MKISTAISKGLVAAAFMFLVAGCNEGGSELSGITPPGGGTGGGDNTSITGNVTTVATTVNPEPASMALLGLGMAGAALLARRKKK